MRLHLADLELDAGLRRADERTDDVGRHHFAQPHPDERRDRHTHAAEQSRDPQPDRDEVEDEQDGGDEQHDRQAQAHDDGDDIDGIALPGVGVARHHHLKRVKAL